LEKNSRTGIFTVFYVTLSKAMEFRTSTNTVFPQPNTRKHSYGISDQWFPAEYQYSLVETHARTFAACKNNSGYWHFILIHV